VWNDRNNTKRDFMGIKGKSGVERGEHEGQNRKRTSERQTDRHTEMQRERETRSRGLGNEDKCMRGIRGER